VDVPLANLDRPFDYTVPADLDADAQPGVRVKVRFAGQLRDGYLLERCEAGEREKLSPLTKVVSPEPVLSAAVAGLVRDVADHYAGGFAGRNRRRPRFGRASWLPIRAPIGSWTRSPRAGPAPRGRCCPRPDRRASG